MKTFLTLAAVVFCAVLIEVSLIYVSKRWPGIGFTVGLKPTLDVF